MCYEGLFGEGGLSAANLDAVLAAIADPTRRAILSRLRAGDLTVMEIAEPFAMSQPAISRHLKVLEGAGLISRGVDGQRRPCRLEAGPLAEAVDWLAGYREFWDAQYRRLDGLLDELQSDRPAVARALKPESRKAARVGTTKRKQAQRRTKANER